MLQSHQFKATPTVTNAVGLGLLRKTAGNGNAKDTFTGNKHYRARAMSYLWGRQTAKTISSHRQYPNLMDRSIKGCKFGKGEQR
jgi:hypothetical protein